MASTPSEERGTFPSEIRFRVLEDHARLRQLLGRTDSLAHRILGGDASCGDEMLDAGRALTRKFLRHLDLEDAILVPALRQIDAWGEERARRVSAEHAAQREQVRELDQLLAVEIDIERIASLLHAFSAELYADMLAEEASVLDADLLRDDVVGVDVEAG